MILSDKTILKMLAEKTLVIEPFGEHFKTITSDTYILLPNQFVLATTQTI